MKKILTIALVALLATASVFAGLSGKAKLALGYDFENGNYGFSNGKEFALTMDIAEETKESVAEGDIYAGIKATMALKADDLIGSDAAFFVKDDSAAIGLGFIFSLKKAYVAGTDWKVAITGTQNGPDFAKSAIDVVFDKYAKDSFGGTDNMWWSALYKAKSYSVSVNKAPGITATYKNWSVAAGFNGGKANATTGAPEFFNYHVSAISPAITVAEGLTVKAGAVASGVKNATKVEDVPAVEVTVEGKKIVVTPASTKKVYDASKNFDAFGASTEVAYASDAFSAKVAADFGMKKTVGTDEFKPGLDVALNAVVSAFTVDAYYQYGEKQWISAQLKADLNSFDVPVALTVYGKDILNGKTFGGKVDVTVDAITASAEASYGIYAEKLTVKGSVAYKTEMFTAKAGANFEKVFKENAESKQLYANASIESDAIISGATLALSYGPKTNNADGSKTTNFFEEGKLGKVEASCTIAF